MCSGRKPKPPAPSGTRISAISARAEIGIKASVASDTATISFFMASP
jgi:hypothetical protein